MRALHLKLWRDLLLLRGQVATVAAVVAAGIAIFVGFQSVYASLQVSRDLYYDRYRFADVFAALERAPESLRERLEELPGVALAQTRATGTVRILLPDQKQPPVGRILSLPDVGDPPLNALHLVSGRLPELGRRNEAVVLASFAEKFQLRPGSSLRAVVEETEQVFQVVGTALSPEFVYPVGAGAMMADETRFTVLWLRRSDIAPALGLSGAFNDVALKLQPYASSSEVRHHLDVLLQPYGGFGAVDREDQPSNAIVKGELQQLESLALALPVVFLFVAAFLLNLVLSRWVALERGQIAALKAVGYSDTEVGLHYFELVLVVSLLGAVAGIGFGIWLGRALHGLYQQFFHFPLHTFRFDAKLFGASLGVSLAAALSGAFLSVRAVVRLPPAEAMRPAAPPNYRNTLFDRFDLTKLLPASSRMIARELVRRPVRTALSILGVALACGILVLGRFNLDAVQALERILFQQMWREDLSLAFTQPVAEHELASLRQVPGVLTLEGLRQVPARIRSTHHYRDISVQGYPVPSTLRTVRAANGEVVTPPSSGLLLTDKLAEVLRVHVGDRVEVEFREGLRRTLSLPVVALVDEVFGMQAHMDLVALSHAMGESPSYSMALLRIDKGEEDNVVRRLQRFPAVAGVTSQLELQRHFRQQSGESVRVMTLFATFFAVVLAIGVVYNNARVALSMRERDLASMRVLGFTRGEISALLLGELGVQVLAALPVGLWVGTNMARAVASTADPERFRFPITLSSETYAFAAAVTLVAGALSALLVRRKLDQLDLIGVLKSRE